MLSSTMAQGVTGSSERGCPENGGYALRPRSEEEGDVAKRRGLATDEGARRIGEHIARLRKERGITQVEMAERLGLSQSIVSKYESGELRLHAELIVRLAELFRTSTDEVLGVKSASAGGAAEHGGRTEQRLMKKLRQVAQLPERDQRAVLRLINSVAAGQGRSRAG